MASRTATPNRTAEPFDVVSVGARNTYTATVSSGEALENVLVDISAPGATFDIEATGRDWAIRNVGIRGQWGRKGKTEPLSVAVAEGASAVIENLYFADGVADETYPGVTGIYVQRSHAGSLKVDRVNIQSMPDNAIYASTPGYPADNDFGLPAGGGGTVEITNSYAADCLASHFRIGTAGSFVENCVAVGGDRGIWVRFGVGLALDSDFSGGSSGDLVVGAPNWPASATATLGVSECRYGTTRTVRDGNRIVGRSVGRPRTEPPDGVPRSAVEAARGTE